MNNDALMAQLHEDVIAMQATALAGGPDLDRAVPTCPGWTVTELLGHLWVIQTWVQSILHARQLQPTPQAGPSPVADFIDGIPDFLSAMRAITVDEPCWNFGPEPRRAGWWIRRQAHEHSIHRLDLGAAIGSTPTVDAALAADGVDEVLSVFYPRQVRLGRIEPITETIRIAADDTGDEWVLGDGDPVASVTADACALYLGVWKRRDLTAVARIDGDAAAVRRTLGVALTP
ncbi:maleylpyruvate isomerase family mycothiol-dependent enzyme [Mycolicibacterium neoaurum]|uniref:maleylpyruvate isomerase family mycothiol-dependent enzyme n=1 Tax=Mycolicibacterium neoaurum TaxID=1795 RepID=UPI00248C7E18|nr:maleylpyruvate isomerase family mycothiol-dependent enzyme [Mycolicibacterium neoaurum]WBP93338.1 maleylpyruvate isomerase family mycothiol-dependent enzyme [Mycolicibacterium neoaurum]WBS06986.1 maleylpyruvate isomerase family mycothiol-dependent enzyme [Mycolicibacterium neoaurum]